jgi:hypothetical protein
VAVAACSGTPSKDAVQLEVGTQDSPWPFGLSVAVVARVTATSGAGSPTGAVAFEDDGTPVGSPVALPPDGGWAFDGLTSLSIGTHVLTAVYSGDAYFPSNRSNPISQVITKGVTSTLLDVVPTADGGVEFEASAEVQGVTNPLPAPTGTLTLLSDGVVVTGSPSAPNPVTIFALGFVTFLPTDIPPGHHSITAVYSGDSNYVGSTSFDVTVSVQ